MILRVTLNGTSENYWERWGLKQNPFPQIAKAELDTAMRQLNSLNGEPLQSVDDIEARLKGWSPEFIALCKKNYVKGERVKFEVTVPDEV